MKYNIPLIFIHVLWYPCCCQDTTQNRVDDKSITSLKFYDRNLNVYTSANIKEVWSICIQKHISLFTNSKFRIKYVTIKTLKDLKTGKNQQVLFGYTNRKRVVIAAKLTASTQGYNFEREIAIYHHCSNVLDVQLENGHWTQQNKATSSKNTVEMILLTF